jgi:LPXTG-site transpeptidase (sortase) family protein
MNKSLWLIFAGVLLIKLTILNLLFGFPGTLFDVAAIVQARYLNNSVPNQSSPVDAGYPDTPSQPRPTSLPTQVAAVPENSSDQNFISQSSRQIEAGFAPDRIVIPSISLDAPVIQAARTSVEIQNQWFEQWSAPDEFAAGWQADSAPLGLVGNTIINGHHNVDGKVFGHLVNTKVGDIILVYSGQKAFEYKIAEIEVLREKNAPLETRQKNAEWISSTSDERLTLVTCWPKRTNTHRLIVVAYPVEAQSIPSSNLNIQ